MPDMAKKTCKTWHRFIYCIADWSKRCLTSVVEGSFVEFVELIAGIKCTTFLTPDMASKIDARHGIGLSYYWLLDAMYGIVYDAMSGAKKLANITPAIEFPTSANELSFMAPCLALISYYFFFPKGLGMLHTPRQAFFAVLQADSPLAQSIAPVFKQQPMKRVWQLNLQPADARANMANSIDNKKFVFILMGLCKPVQC